MPYIKDFLSLLDGNVITEVIWTADIDYWINGKVLAGEGNSKWQTEEGYLELCSDLKIMPYYYYGPNFASFWLARPEYDDTVEVESNKNGLSTTIIWKTPLGEISQETVFMEVSCSEACSKYAVTNRKELDIFRYLIEHRELKPSQVENYSVRLEMWNKYDGIPAIAMPRSPLSAFFYEWAGIMNGVYLLNDYPAALEGIFDLMNDQEIPVIKKICELAPPLVHFADNMSGDVMSGYYHDLMEEGHRRRLNLFHSAGIKCAVHLDGTLGGLLPQLGAAGFDAIEALTPKPCGDMDIERMREAVKQDRVILWGGVPGALFSPPYTWKDLEEFVGKVLRSWCGTRFVLGVADQVPPDGNIEFCKKIAEII